MHTVLTYTAMAAMLVSGLVMGAAALDQYSTPKVVAEACFEGTCATIAIAPSDMVATCQRAAAMPFIQEMGGIKPDSECGRALGL